MFGACHFACRPIPKENLSLLGVAASSSPPTLPRSRFLGVGCAIFADFPIPNENAPLFGVVGWFTAAHTSRTEFCRCLGVPFCMSSYAAGVWGRHLHMLSYPQRGSLHPWCGWLAPCRTCIRG